MSATRPFNEAEGLAEFGDAIRAGGLRLKGIPVMDGQWHRAAAEGDRGARKSGRYRGYLDGVRPAGFIENFKTGFAAPWKANGPLPKMSAATRDAALATAAEANAAAEQRRQARQNTVARRSAIVWEGSPPAPLDHAYFRAKGITGTGLRVDRRGRLRVPMFDLDGKLRGLQSIAPDGRKLFAKGGQVRGTHLLMGDVRPGGVLLIGEGFATGATLREVPDVAVAVAFTKANYVAIAQHYLAQYPGLRVGFCGDNDHHLPRRAKPLPNVGREAAEAAAKATGGTAIVPSFEVDDEGSDWNDWAAIHGLDALRAAITAALPPEPPPLPQTVTLDETSSLLQASISSWIPEEFGRVEARIRRAVAEVAWGHNATPPPAFLPQPEPHTIEALPRGSAGLELIQSSMSGGKTWWLATCAVDAIVKNPTVLGLRRRMAIVCANHLLAKAVVAACRKAGEPHGIRTSWYLGYDAENPASPGERMCPAHALRRQANAAGLDSNKACKARIRPDDAEDGENAAGRFVYCSRHPNNPNRTLPPCGYLSNDLDGDIVVFAGWGTMVRSLKKQFRRHVTLEKRGTEGGEKGGTIKVEVPPFDALICDEMDLDQLLSRLAPINEEDTEEAGRTNAGLSLDRIQPEVWPDMLQTDLWSWEAGASYHDLHDMAECRRLLRAARDALVSGPMSPKAMAAVSDPGGWRSASRWVWKAKSQDASAVRPNMRPDTLRERTTTLREHNRMVGTQALLLRLIAEMVEHCPEDEITELVAVFDGRVRMQHAHDLAPWMAELSPLLCDAKNQLDFLATWWPERKLRTSIVIQHADAGVRHVVAHDRMGTYSSLTPGKGGDTKRVTTATNKATASADRADILAWLFDGKAMIGGPKGLNRHAQDLHKARQAILATGPTREEVRWIHFGAGRGLNIAEDVRAQFDEGRPLPPSRDVEITRALLRHGRPVPIEERGYILVPSFHRMTDGTVRRAERYGHRDPVADALVRLYSVDELEQLEQRSRPRRRDASRPLLTMSLSKLPLEDGRRVDELVSARDLEMLHPEAVAAARGFVVNRKDRGAVRLLAEALRSLDSDATHDREVDARRLSDRLRGFSSAGIWEAANAALTLSAQAAGDLVAAASPEALAVSATFGDGWAGPARTKIMGEAVMCFWHVARVRLPGLTQWTRVAVRGRHRAAAAAALATLLGEGATVEWSTAPTRPEPPQPASESPAMQMVHAGIVLRDPDHAMAAFPGICTSRGDATRAIAEALSAIGQGTGNSSKNPSSAGNPYIIDPAWAILNQAA
ncbi:hypothetical protein E2C06_34950 [Dankookia rubra]|uniref:Toprim domain-containing protein n=1 Tax=Dankookia rubra TaxID=1442381 RepID=A0A4R5Q4X9_9PROT|nr:toprim domain-containing protein [Dankookia rubra]TDH57992.1 hypothetical protein E2C06_34950 [Dankookia rubra]